MKVALIPPLGWEHYLAQSDGVLMALAVETCMDSVNYGNSMKLIKQTSASRKLLILDNGAAEGHRAKHSVINKYAAYLGADEIVLPDVMGSRTETISKVGEFFRQTKWNPDINYMGVVQGRSMKHAMDCVREYDAMQVRRASDTEVYQPITTLGIPRLLIGATDSMAARIDLANWILNEFGLKYNIHFLGASTEWPHEIRYVAKYAPHVRSFDTSLPFVYACAGIDLRNVTPGLRSKLDRPNGYLVGNLTTKHTAIVQSNIDTYLSWAKG